MRIVIDHCNRAVAACAGIGLRQRRKLVAIAVAATAARLQVQRGLPLPIRTNATIPVTILNVDALSVFVAIALEPLQSAAACRKRLLSTRSNRLKTGQVSSLRWYVPVEEAVASHDGIRLPRY